MTTILLSRNEQLDYKDNLLETIVSPLEFYLLNLWRILSGGFSWSSHTVISWVTNYAHNVIFYWFILSKTENIRFTIKHTLFLKFATSWVSWAKNTFRILLAFSSCFKIKATVKSFFIMIGSNSSWTDEWNDNGVLWNALKLKFWTRPYTILTKCLEK